MAGYWPRSFFCVFMDRDGVEVHKHARAVGLEEVQGSQLSLCDDLIDHFKVTEAIMPGVQKYWANAKCTLNVWKKSGF